MRRGDWDGVERIRAKPSLTGGVDLAWRLSKDAELYSIAREGKRRDVNRSPQTRRL